MIDHDTDANSHRITCKLLGIKAGTQCQVPDFCIPTGVDPVGMVKPAEFDENVTMTGSTS
jgi:hypothetical protein